VIGSVIERRNVDAPDLPRKRWQQLEAGRFPLPGRQPEFQELGYEAFSFSHKDEIQKRSQWFGVHEGCNAARRDVGVTCPALLAEGREPGQPEHLNGVAEIVFEGDGKGDQLEISERPLRLDAQQPAGLLPEGWQVFRFGIEDPFADHLLETVQKLVDRLETQVRHADGVTVGEGQGNGQLSAPIFADRSPFFSQPLLVPRLQFPQHNGILMGATLQ